MRLVPLLFVAASLAFAGCFGSSDDPETPPEGTTPTSPTGTATTTPTGTTPTTPTGTGTNTTTPTTPLAPKSLKKAEVDFSNPAQAPAEVTVTVDPGYTTLTLNVTFVSTAGQGSPFIVAQNLQIKAGSLECPVGQGPQTGDVKCNKTGAATPGALKITFAGVGAAKATYELIES